MHDEHGTSVQTYVTWYNAWLAGAWTRILYLLCTSVWYGKDRIETYDGLRNELLLAQTLAIMEVIHAAVGIVRSSAFLTAMQVASRLVVVWAVLQCVPSSQNAELVLVNGTLKLNVISLLLAWSITEIIRYTFYMLKELDALPYMLSWMRYTAFILLYPIGVASELVLAWSAWNHAAKHGGPSIKMPNAFNFGIDYSTCILVFMGAYFYGFPMLYMHMVHQRKKVLSSISRGKQRR